MSEHTDDGKAAYLRCACHIHMLQVTPLDEGDVELAIWEYGTWPQQWRHRLRFLWSALRGHPYGDQMLLHRGQAEQLARTLLRISTPGAGNWTITPTEISATHGPTVRYSGNVQLGESA